MSDEPRAIPVIIMRPGEKIEPAAIWLPKQDAPGYFGRLKDAVEAITGGPFEHVTVFDDFDGGDEFRYLDMFVHERGQLLGMPINERATVIYRQNVLIHEVPPPAASDLPDIAGPAVLFRDRVWF